MTTIQMHTTKTTKDQDAAAWAAWCDGAEARAAQREKEYEESAAERKKNGGVPTLVVPAVPTPDYCFKTWNLQGAEELDEGPIGCGCSALSAMDEHNGFSIWACRHGQWIIPRVRELSETDVKHEGSACPGHCLQHPLLTRSALAFRAQEDQGLSWGDIAEMDYRASLAAETPAQTAARLKKEEADEAAATAGIVRYSVNKKADKWCKGGEMKFRVPRPCKYQSLFLKRECAGCGAKVPEGQTRCTAKKGHTVCGEDLNGCWAHEKSHSCIYIHPDEPQWADALAGTLCYDRERQVFHLRGEGPPAPVAAATRDFRGLGGGGARGPAAPQFSGVYR